MSSADSEGAEASVVVVEEGMRWMREVSMLVFVGENGLVGGRKLLLLCAGLMFCSLLCDALVENSRVEDSRVVLSRVESNLTDSLYRT